MKQIVTKFEVLFTLECHWQCADCCRALDICYPEGSHITIDQAERLIQYLKNEKIIIKRLKIDGGEICCNPDLEKLLWLFQSAVPDLFPKLNIQTAYSRKVFLEKYNLPEGMKIRCDPPTEKHYKRRHLPVFVSPTELGILPEGKPPPQGSWLTKKQCITQGFCGRTFSRWGFTACGQEPILGVLLGINPYSKTFKQWADPEICKHCVFSCGRKMAYRMRVPALKRELPQVSSVFDFANLRANYRRLTEELDPW